MPPPLLYFKVNICPLPLPHFASIFFTYLWSCRWPNYIVTLPRYFSFRLPHLNIPTRAPSDELDKSIRRNLRLKISHIILQSMSTTINVVNSNPAQTRCTRSNIMWQTLSVTCDRSVVFTRYYDFFPLIKLTAMT